MATTGSSTAASLGSPTAWRCPSKTGGLARYNRVSGYIIHICILRIHTFTNTKITIVVRINKINIKINIDINQ